MDRARINKELEKITEELVKDIEKKEELLKSVSDIQASMVGVSDKQLDINNKDYLLDYKELQKLMDDMIEEAEKGKYFINVSSRRLYGAHILLLKLGYKLSYYSFITKGPCVSIQWKELFPILNDAYRVAIEHNLKTAEEMHDISVGHKKILIKNGLSMVAKDIARSIKDCKYSVVSCTAYADINKDIFDNFEAMGYTVNNNRISWEDPHLNTIGVSDHNYVSPEGIIPAMEANHRTDKNIKELKNKIKSELFDQFLSTRSKKDSRQLITPCPLSDETISSFKREGISVERIESCNYKFSW